MESSFLGGICQRLKDIASFVKEVVSGVSTDVNVLQLTWNKGFV